MMEEETTVLCACVRGCPRAKVESLTFQFRDLAKADALYCCWRNHFDFDLPPQGETSVPCDLRGSDV